jgi:hypothetical protein
MHAVCISSRFQGLRRQSEKKNPGNCVGLCEEGSLLVGKVENRVRESDSECLSVGMEAAQRRRPDSARLISSRIPTTSCIYLLFVLFFSMLPIAVPTSSQLTSLKRSVGEGAIGKKTVCDADRCIALKIVN